MPHCNLPLVAVMVFVSMEGAAQNIGYLRRGNVEAGVFGGFATGLGRTAAGLGGNVAIAASRHVLPYFEVTQFPDLLNRAAPERLEIQGLSETATVRRKNSFTDFHGGLHLRIPFSRRPEIMPYFSFGLGVLRKSVGEAQVVNWFSLPDPAANDLATNFGGGLRWYARQNLGLRVELKAYKPFSTVDAFNDTFAKFTVGIFYVWSR